MIPGQPQGIAPTIVFLFLIHHYSLLLDSLTFRLLNFLKLFLE